MPKTICVLHAKTLEQAKYYLKIMFEVSEEHYSHSQFTPIYGNGQGSTNSTHAWLFISNDIFKCHSQEATGASYSAQRKIFQFPCTLQVLLTISIFMQTFFK